MKKKIRPVLGVDFGNTIARNYEPMPDSLRVIRRLAYQVFGGRVFVVSKVNREQERKVREALHDHNILEAIGITLDRVIFCANRADKAQICREKDITHMIDDRPEVMVGMPVTVRTLVLMAPDFVDLARFAPQLRPVTIVRNWLDIEEYFFGQV